MMGIMNRWWYLFIVVVIVSACSKPIDHLISLEKIALVAVEYDPTIYTFDPNHGIDFDVPFAEFNNDPGIRDYHERLLNEFLVDLMGQTKLISDISIVRPLTLVDTSLLLDTDSMIRYEYLMEPYDPIDITNHEFMGGLAVNMNVGAVAKVAVIFAISTDDSDMWDDYDNRSSTNQAMTYRSRLKQSHETSQLRTQITLTVVDKTGEEIYSETRYVDVNSDQITITDADLSFPGGVSPQLLELGLNEWIQDWVQYLPEYR